MDFLTGLNSRQAIYWCKRQTSNEELPAKVNKLLTQDNDRVVNIPDFDVLMSELATIYDCQKLIDKKNIEQSHIVQEATKRAKQFQRQIDAYINNTKDSTSPESPIRDLASDWYDYQIKVDKATDITKKERIYEEGTAATENPYLIGNYANFLTDIKKDHEAAEKHYLNALEAEPNDANINANYAIFLTDIRNNNDAAEEHYLKALETEPNNANVNVNYANFLKKTRSDYDAAEEHYLKALETEPNNANANVNYAIFLTGIRKDHDAAEEHYLKALEAQPNGANINANYAIFLTDIRKDHDAAEKHHLKALEAEPNNADINGNYAKDLFIFGKTKLAIKHLELAEEMNKAHEFPELALECAFYKYAHLPNKREHAELEIISLLEQGISSEGFDLSQNVEKAITEGHPNIQALRDYAQRISAL